MVQRFSKRTDWSRRESGLHRVFREVRVDDDCIDLSSSNPTLLGLPSIDVPHLTAKTYRPCPLGTSEAREAIAAYYQRRNISVDPERIIITSSTSEAYSHLFRLLLDPGEPILLPQPSYPLFEYLAELADVSPQSYRIAYDGSWYYDPSTFGENARAIVVVSPNNPTGNIANHEERERIKASTNAIISDEVFADYTPSHRAATWINDDERLTFSLNGLSKVAGLPQHKLSWMVLSGPASEVKEATARLELILDTYLCVASDIQAALASILAQVDPWQVRLRQRIEDNRHTLESALKDQAITVRSFMGGWVAILEMPRTQTDEAWALALARESKTIVQPGYFYEMSEPSCLVISLIVKPAQFETGIKRILSLQKAKTD